MNNLAKLGLGLTAAVLIGMPLAAQQLSYGGQVTVAIPAGPLTSNDWLDGQVGGGAGFNVLVPITGGHAIVPRVDYTYFKKTKDGVDRKVQMVEVGADYNYFLRGKVNEGPYVGGGVGYGASKFKLEGQGASVSDTPNTAYADACGGWMLTRNMGVEVRYIYAQYKPDVTGFAPRNYQGKPTVDAPTINASFIFRF